MEGGRQAMGEEETVEAVLRELATATTTFQQAERLLAEAQQMFARALDRGLIQDRGQVWHRLHRAQRFLQDSPVYFSQSGQDRILDLYFLGNKQGVFVDVGSYDGISGSNTLFFEIHRHWSGLCIEASLTQHQQAAGFRRARCLNVAIGPEPGWADFLEITSGYTMMSGLIDSYHPTILEGVRANPDHCEVIHRVPVRTLEDLLTEEGMTTVDLVSLDIEGGELAVLEAFPFQRFEVSAWSIENTQHGDRLRNLMEANSYQLFEIAGVDEIYVKRPL